MKNENLNSDYNVPKNEKIVKKDPYLSLSILASTIILSLAIVYSAGLRAEKSETQFPRLTVDIADVIPKGIPAVYGAELNVSYDNINPQTPQLADQTIEKLALIDVETKLSGRNLERYINVLYVMEGGMSCEYCCDARSVIFENGEAACGCAHSYAMRGLTKYLILEHGERYSDGEIYEEIGKWKTLFFPNQINEKAQILRDEGFEISYANLASNKYRGIERGTGGGMVGDC